MDRRALTNAQWARMEPYCLGKPSDPGRSGSNNRGKSKGGWTTKILALTDALGNLVRFVLQPGNRYDTIGVPHLINGIDFQNLLADKAFDCNWLNHELNERGAGIVISQRPKRLQPLKIDEVIYE